jgi:UDP-N-acetylmuramate-alanine ligase
MRKIFLLLDEKGTAIVNVDESELIQFLQGMKHYIVTFGFNSKASITTSSIGDFLFKDNFMCCLQRTISTRNGMLIEPQEYKIRLETGELNTYDVLAAATFAIVNGVDLNSVGFSEPLRS